MSDGIAPFDPDAYARAWPGRNNRPVEEDFADEAEYTEYARVQPELDGDFEEDIEIEEAPKFFAPSPTDSSEKAEREAIDAMTSYSRMTFPDSVTSNENNRAQILQVGLIFSNLAIARAIREQTEASKQAPVAYKLNRDSGEMKPIAPRDSL